MSKVMASGNPLATAAAAAGADAAGRPRQQQGGRQLGGVGDGQQAAGRGHDVHLVGDVGEALQVGAAHAAGGRR